MTGKSDEQILAALDFAVEVTCEHRGGRLWGKVCGRPAVALSAWACVGRCNVRGVWVPTCESCRGQILKAERFSLALCPRCRAPVTRVGWRDL